MAVTSGGIFYLVFSGYANFSKLMRTIHTSMTSTLGQSVGLDVWHVGFFLRNLCHLVSVSIAWFALYVFTGLSNSFMRSFLSRPFQINAGPTSVADPDLEIREGGSLVIQTLRQGWGRSPPQIFSSLRALVSSKIKRGTAPPGSFLDPPLNIIK